MHSYAQTISQLYSQLQRNGYSVTDMCRIRDAYELAMELFSGYFQSSGKLLIAHVVGTASILASLRLPVEVVAAGLLHNVYQTGDFGDGRRGTSDARREQVRRVVGKEAEQYVARFATLRLNPQTITAIRDKPHELEPSDRHTVLLRLADQLEHLLDLNVLYRSDIARQGYVERGPVAIDIAERLGFSTLATDLRRALEETHSTTIPIEPHPSRGSVVAPQSHHRRLSVVFRRLLTHGLHRLRSSTRLRRLLSFWTSSKVRGNKG
jgi:(p)ppGpp synthase/HD superfamily hydrolase